jgi:hypothetical protein
MLFEWDENKRRRNVSDHGVDFVDVVQVFDGRPTFTYRSPRNDEDRWGTVAIVQDRFYLVVWTPRGERRRIISAYRADDWEIREYRALHG